MANTSTPRRKAAAPLGGPAVSRRLRAADYLRVSTEEQRGGYGIASQARRNRRFVDSRGWEHLDSYTAEGVSGAKGMGSRGGFDRLMHDAEKRLFDVVVVEKGDRIGRTGRAFWRWVWALEDLGIFVAIVDRGIDNTTQEGRAQMRREADYAETEWENIRSRTQGACRRKRTRRARRRRRHVAGRRPTDTASKGRGHAGRTWSWTTKRPESLAGCTR
jgi:DNA invertase Pin-like site-specific DNA recombinase